MSPPDQGREPVFQTPWFQVYAAKSSDSDQPHYSIDAPDFAMVVGLNARGHLLLVRQFRPSIGRMTLELPAGHVERGETPEEAARKELCEETGCEADTMELLGPLHPSTARFTNRMWVFFAPEVRRAAAPKHEREQGLEAVFHLGSISSLLKQEEFIAASSCAALFMAAARGRLKM